MGSISIEGYIRPLSYCLNITINNSSGGANKEELDKFITNFNSLDTNSVDVDSTTGISVKISLNKNNILEQADDGLFVSLDWIDIQ